jgi:hypothetical protein
MFWWMLWWAFQPMRWFGYRVARHAAWRHGWGPRRGYGGRGYGGYGQRWRGW